MFNFDDWNTIVSFLKNLVLLVSGVVLFLVIGALSIILLFGAPIFAFVVSAIVTLAIIYDKVRG